MKSAVSRFATAAATRILAHTPLQYWPVRVRHGFLRGCRWTLWPHSAYWRGNYEPEVQAALSRVAPAAGGCAWDLGAHFGFYTLWLARAVGPAGQVCAFEPDHVSFSRLQRHVAMNHSAHVRLYHRAVSDSAGERTLVLSQGGGATTSHLPYHGEVTPSEGTVSVRSVALDELVREDGLTPPQFIKIDIEGHAAAALRGARRTIAAGRPTLLVSIHSPDELEGVRSEIAPLGYAPLDLAGRPMSWEATLFQTALFQAS